MPHPILTQARKLLHSGQTEAALALLRPARRDHPEHAGIALALADALHAAGDLAAASTCYAEALRRDDSPAEGWYAAGCANLTLQRYATAAACLARAAALAPGSGAVHYNLAKSLFELGHVEQSVATFEHAAALDPALSAMAQASIACIIPGSVAADNAAVLAARRRWAATLREAAMPPPPRDGTRTMRIGYLSAFFGARNWMKPVFALINRHDRTRFEIHMFSDGPPPSAESGYRDHAADLIYDLRGVPNAQAGDIIHGAGIDVLVDLNGYSYQSRLPVLMRHPARQLVGWFNMFATTGIAAFDWLVGDHAVIPLAEEAHYCEAIHRLPGTYLAFEVLYDVPDVAPAPSLTQGACTFGCLGSQYKLTDTVLAAWADILHAAPRAGLFVKNGALQDESVRQSLLARLAALGVAPDRIVLDGRSEHFDFLASYRHVDIALDTFPYNGGTTTTEALWQGVPVLTFDGDRWASRTSTSLLRAAGMADWVMPDRAAYIGRAIELANDPATPAMLAPLRAGMRARLAASAACDGDGLCREMEDFYESIRKEGLLFFKKEVLPSFLPLHLPTTPKNTQSSAAVLPPAQRLVANREFSAPA
jgi:predicted O-linked N-acetylglucosamine transferase (SPINDLY family)